MARGPSSSKLVVGTILGLALIGAACATKTPSAAGPTTPTTSPSPSASASGGGRYGGGYGGGYGSGSGQGTGSTSAVTLQQGAGGYVFSPAKLTVAKGQTIDVKNVGTIPHTFTISSKGINVVNSGGQSQSVKINLAPGTYTFICTYHVSLGMKGTLIVKG